MAHHIALAGNPNSGKTTLFNALTGSRQHVGNYPGITVEKKEGVYRNNGSSLHITDLPGTYSLTAYSLEEMVARDFLVNEKPAVVVNIVDASNLERNLYLTLQFMELGVPICLAVNMMDVAEKRGIQIDTERLENLLGIPVLPMVARKEKGMAELMEAVDKMRTSGDTPPCPAVSYGRDVDEALNEIAPLIQQTGFLTDRFPARWTALKYLENDAQVRQLGKTEDPATAARLEAIAERLNRHIRDTANTYTEAVIADHRYGWIQSMLQQGVISRQYDFNRIELSDKIDMVLTNRLVGPIAMALVLFGLYQFTFTYSEAPVAWFESFFAWSAGLAETHLPDGLLKSMLVSGVIDGVGGVLGFVPLIMFMFFGIAFLEDTGYLARVAFMLDRVFRTFGLHGASVMPFIVSGGIAGGCAVPGVMATRTLKSPKERLATLLTVPFMNCGAKLPVFALLVATFFPNHMSQMMFLITLVAWAGALLVAKLLRSTVVRGESTPFVMELPPYRLPTLKGLFIHTWERTWQYIKKAGTVILGISILLWAMMTFPGLDDRQTAVFEAERQAALASVPAAVSSELASGNDLSPQAESLQKKLLSIEGRQAEAALQNSLAGRLGTMLEGVTQWAGFDWRTNIALVGGFAAKEVVVSTLGTAYSLGEVDPESTGTLGDNLAASPAFRPLTALSLIVFIMFYAPCFVAVVCIGREAGSWKWGAFSMVFNTVLAFMLSVMVYQIGGLLGF